MSTFPALRTFRPVATLTKRELFDEMQFCRQEAWRFHKAAAEAPGIIRKEVLADYIAWAKRVAFHHEDRAVETEAAFRAF